jgi:hypothetical protein
VPNLLQTSSIKLIQSFKSKLAENLIKNNPIHLTTLTNSSQHRAESLKPPPLPSITNIPHFFFPHKKRRTNAGRYEEVSAASTQALKNASLGIIIRCEMTWRFCRGD